MLEETFRASYGLLLLKKGPQDMPAGAPATLGAGLVYVASSFLLLRLQGADTGTAILQAFADLAILLGFAWIVLRQRGFPARLEQTMTALLVSGLVFGLLSAPCVHSLSPYLKTLAHGGQPPAPSIGLAATYLLLIVIVVWSLTVMVHILRHALEVGVAAALGLTVVYQIASLLIMTLLFGGAGR